MAKSTNDRKNAPNRLSGKKLPFYPPGPNAKGSQSLPSDALPYKPKPTYRPKPHPTTIAIDDGMAKRITRYRKLPLIVCGTMVFGMSCYGAMMWSSLQKQQSVGKVPDDVSDRYDKNAEGYDEKVDMSEYLLGISSRRKELMQQVRGHVLESAVGTGRNIQYYPTRNCSTVTLLDSSKPMLDVAKRKWRDTHPEYFRRVYFKHQTATDPVTPPYGAQDGYDTVVQTMGLCSTPEPVKLLQNLGSVTSQDGGQILLLEHGKSHYQWLNNLLDKTAPAHANEHGCWWNKDIGNIVEESGLEVVRIKRYNLGTTWWIELKPRREIDARGEVQAMDVAQQKPWWSLWR